MSSANGIRAGKAFVEIGANAAPLDAALLRVSSRFQAMGSSLAQLGAGMMAASGSVLGALAWPLQLASNLETTQAAFETMLKDARAAKVLLDQVAKFGAETPFEFPELAEATKKMLAFGSSSATVVEELRRIGDVSSGIGAPIGEIAEIYGKARVQGRLFAEDINQLTGRGIPIIQQLSQQFGVTDTEVKKLVESGQVGFANLEQAFIAMTTGAGQFAGGMARQAKTLSGLWSTLKDAIGAAARPIGEALIPVVGQLLAVVTNLLEPVGKWIQAHANLAPLIAATAGGLFTVGAGITAMGIAAIAASGVLSALGTVVGVVSSMYAFFTTGLGASAIGMLAQSAATLIATASTVGLGAALTAVLAPLYGTAAAVAALALPLIAAGTAFLAFGAYVAYETGIIGASLSAVGGWFGSLFAVANEALTGIMGAMAAGQFGLAAQMLWASIKLAFYTGADGALQGVAYLWNNALTMTLSFGRKLAEIVYNVFSQLPSLMMSAMQGGASLGAALASMFTTGLNLEGVLDEQVAAARAELDALKAQIKTNEQPTGQANAAGPGKTAVPMVPSPAAVSAVAGEMKREADTLQSLQAARAAHATRVYSSQSAAMQAEAELTARERAFRAKQLADAQAKFAEDEKAKIERAAIKNGRLAETADQAKSQTSVSGAFNASLLGQQAGLTGIQSEIAKSTKKTADGVGVLIQRADAGGLVFG